MSISLSGEYDFKHQESLIAPIRPSTSRARFPGIPAKPPTLTEISTNFWAKRTFMLGSASSAATPPATLVAPKPIDTGIARGISDWIIKNSASFWRNRKFFAS